MKQFKELDTNHDGQLSRQELMAGHSALGLTEQQAEALFVELDTDLSGFLSPEEFMEHYKQQQVAFEKSNLLEGIRSLILEPRRPAGVMWS